MSPEALVAALAGLAVLILAMILLRRGSAASSGDAGSRPQAQLDERRFFAWAIFFLGLAYFTLQGVYALRMPLADDEFAGAKAAHLVTERVPYRDFMPYKTVVGYYIQSLPLYFADNLWAGISLIRVENALINTLVLLFVAFRLRRHFRDSAVCLGLALLVVMSTFVERSWVIRVDMLGSLCGLLSLVYLLDRRPGWAGALAGLGCLMTQKSVYFVLAGGVALGGWWLWGVLSRGAGGARDLRRAFRDAALFAAAAAGVIVVYFAFWSQVGSFHQAVVRVSETTADVGLSDRPYICPRAFWWQTLRRNPGFYAAASFALAALAVAVWRRRRYRDWLLLTYGGAMVALSVWHKQPCPYFFVILLPTLFVAIVDLFDRLGKGFAGRPARWRALSVLVFLGLGLGVPLSRLPHALQRDNGFQRHTVALADNLLRPGDTYLASLPILYDRDQAIPEFRWLDDLNRRRLHAKSPEEHREIVTRLDEARLKLLIMNYRMEDLPQALRDYFARHYAHFWGNIFLYAPFVARQPRPFHVEFEGVYRADFKDEDGPVVIDGQSLTSGERLRLATGTHVKSSAGSVRLRFIPENLDPSLLDPDYRQSQDMFSFSFHY